MHPDDQRSLMAIAGGAIPLVAWLLAVRLGEGGGAYSLGRLLALARLTATAERPVLLGSLLGGVALALVLLVFAARLTTPARGATAFRTHLRGTKLASPGRLSRVTRERRERQVTIAGIPMPTAIECLHLLVGGSTGSGKSVLIREIAFSALRRGDRIVVADPNGDMVAKFHRAGDVILNPYDARGLGWTFFNEIRAEYDFKRFALSLVPRGRTKEEEEWCAYARLLLRETARKLWLKGQASVKELFRFTTLAEVLPDALAGPSQ